MVEKAQADPRVVAMNLVEEVVRMDDRRCVKQHSRATFRGAVRKAAGYPETIVPNAMEEP